jgi:hypothetical protein
MSYGSEQDNLPERLQGGNYPPPDTGTGGAGGGFIPAPNYIYHYPTYSTTIHSTCTENNHWFRCKHERFCECGNVERKGWDQQMDEGL